MENKINGSLNHRSNYCRSRITYFCLNWCRVAISVKRIEFDGKGSQEKSASKISIFLWAIVGALVGTVITFIILGKMPFFSSEYDDFNNLLYRDSINTDLWKRLQNLNCDVKQENGTAVFRLNDLSEENSLCYLDMPNKVEWNKIGAVESRILAEDDASGDYSIGIIEFRTNGFSSDTIWVAQCGIIQTPKEKKTELFFYVDNSYPNGNPETYQTIAASTKEFYKMRLEIDPDTGVIRCFVNDKILGSHIPTNIDILEPQLFSRRILGFWSPRSSGTFRADDVFIKP